MKEPQFTTTATVQVLVEVTLGPYTGEMSISDLHTRVKRDALAHLRGMCIDTGDRQTKIVSEGDVLLLSTQTRETP